MDPALHETLAGWGNFYLITGTAAAALTGLQFVVQSLLASDLQLRDDPGDPEGGIAAFGTPTVVHFTMAVAISCVMCMPWPSSSGLRETLGALGLGALLYSTIVLRRTLRQRVYQPVGEDWLWHVLLPTAAYGAVLLAAFLFIGGRTVPLFAVAIATLLLLCVGIHNAWDTVIYLTVTTLQNRRTRSIPEPVSPGVAQPAKPLEPPAIIRPAAPADLPAIGKLGALLVRTHHDFDPARFIPATPLTEQGYADFLGTQLERPGVVILVAEREGQVAGYAYAGLEGKDYMALRGPAGAVYDLVVDPAQRGLRIGRQLLDETLAALEALGAPRAVLSTAEQNTAAQHLFARAGFRRTMQEMTRELGGGRP